MKTLMRGVFGAFILFLTISGIPQKVHSAVINACVSKNDGSVRIVSSASQCSTRRETAVSWNQVGPTGPTGPAGLPGPAGVAGTQGVPGPAGAGALMVYDVNNNVVGPMISNWQVVIKPTGTFPLILGLLLEFNGAANFGGFNPSSYVSFYHTSSDCTGTRYLQYYYMSPSNIFVQGNTVYYGSLPQQTITIASRSDYYNNGVSNGDVNGPAAYCQTFTNPFNESAGIVATFDLSTIGTPPFTVR